MELRYRVINAFGEGEESIRYTIRVEKMPCQYGASVFGSGVLGNAVGGESKNSISQDDIFCAGIVTGSITGASMKDLMID